MKQQKQDRRSQRTRRLVTTAMTELLSQKRYDAITVQDILDRARIGRSTFYTHYFDKEDVLASVVEQQLELFRQHSSQQDAGQRIVPSLELFRHAQEHYGLMHLMVRGRSGEVLWETGQALLSRDIEQALTHLRPETRTSASPAVPLAVIARYLAGALWNLFEWWMEAEMPYSPEQMDMIFQRLALPGVRATIQPDTPAQP